jgi:hypothetical protein
MGWLSDKWDELTGKNQKVAQGTVQQEYEDAFSGARTDNAFLKERGYEMMDPDSAFNQAQFQQFQTAGADATAEASRLAQRNISMGGGGNSTATAFNVADAANNASASSNAAYTKYLMGAMDKGTGVVSGASNNLTDMNMKQMTALSDNRLANASIDSAATGLGVNLLGKGMSMAFGMPPMQEGGQVPRLEEDSIQSQIISEQDSSGRDTTRSLNQSGGGFDYEGGRGTGMWDYQEATGPKTGKDVMVVERDGKLYKQPTQHYGGGLIGNMLAGGKNMIGRAIGEREIDEMPQEISSMMGMNEGGEVPQTISGAPSSLFDRRHLSASEVGRKALEPVEKYLNVFNDMRRGKLFEGYDNHRTQQVGPSISDQKEMYMQQVNDSQGGGLGAGMMGFNQGGHVPNRGGMLSQIPGPDGIPLQIRTRIGGQLVG